MYTGTKCDFEVDMLINFKYLTNKSECLIPKGKYKFTVYICVLLDNGSDQLMGLIFVNINLNYGQNSPVMSTGTWSHFVNSV